MVRPFTPPALDMVCFEGGHCLVSLERRFRYKYRHTLIQHDSPPQPHVSPAPRKVSLYIYLYFYLSTFCMNTLKHCCFEMVQISQSPVYMSCGNDFADIVVLRQAPPNRQFPSSGHWKVSHAPNQGYFLPRTTYFGERKTLVFIDLG